MVDIDVDQLLECQRQQTEHGECLNIDKGFHCS
jgi:hypothetical protein